MPTQSQVDATLAVVESGAVGDIVYNYRTEEQAVEMYVRFSHCPPSPRHPSCSHLCPSISVPLTLLLTRLSKPTRPT